MLLFCIVLIFALIFMTLDRWQKVTLETCFTCIQSANFWFYVFQGNAATYL